MAQRRIGIFGMWQEAMLAAHGLLRDAQGFAVFRTAPPATPCTSLCGCPARWR